MQRNKKKGKEPERTYFKGFLEEIQIGEYVIDHNNLHKAIIKHYQETYPKYVDEQYLEEGIKYMKELVRRNSGLEITDEEGRKRFLNASADLTFHYMMEGYYSNIGNRMLSILTSSQFRTERFFQGEIGLPKMSAEQIKKEIFLNNWSFEAKQIGITVGGDRRGRTEWKKPETLEDYRAKVNDLHPLWNYIVKFYRDRFEDSSWMEDLKGDKTYKTLSKSLASVPQDLLKRVADEDVEGREREPLALALEHARRELDLPEQDTETLRRKYGRKNRKNRAS